MKFVYLANVRIPTEKAHGYQICKMCEEFSHSGVEVELIVPARKNNIKETVFVYYGLDNNFSIKMIRIFDFLQFDKFLFNRGMYLNSLFFLLRSCFMKFSKDSIIFTRNQEIAWLFKKRGFIVIYECHDWFEKNKKSTLFFLKKVDLIISTNSYIKEEFSLNGFNENRLLAISNGVDLEKFNLKITKEAARKKVGLPADKKIILYSGSFYLYDWKGIDVLLGAAKLLGDGYLIVLLGGNDKEVNDINDNYKLDNLLLINKRPQYEIPVYLKAADVLVLPNKSGAKTSEKYTSPLKLFEYMASGTPIVASDLPSIREILNEDNAILVESNNVDALISGIKKVFQDSEVGAKIANKGIGDVKNYTWKKRVEGILNFVKKHV